MNAIENSNIIDINTPPVNTVGFTPDIQIVNDGWPTTISFSDNSTLPDGDTFSKANIKVHDKQGNVKYGVITTLGGLTGNIVLSGLDLTEDLTVTATIVTTLGCISDGSFQHLNAGTPNSALGNWTVGQFTTAVG